jgi:hypothetical protein
MYVTAKGEYIVLGLATLIAGSAAFFIWARQTRGWPFEPTMNADLAERKID